MPGGGAALLSAPAGTGGTMPIFIIERRYAEQLEEAHPGGFEQINRINEAEGVRWLYSFLAADRRKSYCLYEAPSADWIVRAAAAAGLPADVIVEVDATVTPDGVLSGI